MDRLPSDVEVSLLSVHAEHLQKQQEQILHLLRLHEQELIMVWLLLCGILLVELHNLRVLKERYG
jgi:hypothetical protein